MCPSLAVDLGPIILSFHISEDQFAWLLNGDNNTYLIGLWGLNVLNTCMPSSVFLPQLHMYLFMESSVAEVFKVKRELVSSSEQESLLNKESDGVTTFIGLNQHTF